MADGRRAGFTAGDRNDIETVGDAIHRTLRQETARCTDQVLLFDAIDRGGGTAEPVILPGLDFHKDDRIPGQSDEIDLRVGPAVIAFQYPVAAVFQECSRYRFAPFAFGEVTVLSPLRRQTVSL